MSSGNWTLAQADSLSNAEAIGVVDEIIDANTFVVVTHGYTSKLSGLTADTVYYLDPSTAGALTATKPTTIGQIAKAILYAKSATEVYVYDRTGVEVERDWIFFKENHVITSAEDTTGFFTLSQVPSTASIVSATVVSGPQQVNTDAPNRSATPDFQILGSSSDEFHFNNNGSATGLSAHLKAGHEVMVEYMY